MTAAFSEYWPDRFWIREKSATIRRRLAIRGGSSTWERRLSCGCSAAFRLCFLTGGTYATDAAFFLERLNVDIPSSATVKIVTLKVNDQAAANLKIALRLGIELRPNKVSAD